MQANVFVQKDDLLVGTDIQPQLGLSLSVTGKDGRVTGLSGASAPEEEREKQPSVRAPHGRRGTGGRWAG